VRPALLILVTTLGLLPVVGCKASVSVNAEAGGKKETFDERPPPPPPSSDLAAPVVKTAFIGVSHALSLTPEAATKPSCRCMAAVIGPPTDGAFIWRGTPPTVGDDALVLGISNDGTPCDLAAQGRGPSIQGVEQEGNNIIVTIEEARNGVPQARGAVFPRPPQGDSYLIFRSSRRQLPYDDALPGAGSQVCRIQIGAAAAAPAGTNSQSATPSRRAGAPVETYLAARDGEDAREATSSTAAASTL
jgi:hypothetical protein